MKIYHDFKIIIQLENFKCKKKIKLLLNELYYSIDICTVQCTPNSN